VGFLPTLLQVDQGFTSTQASLVYASVFVVGLLVKPVAGQLSDRIRRLTVAIGSFVLGIGGLAVLIAANSIPMAVLGTAGYALGHRSFPPVMQAYLMDRFPDESMAGDLGAIRTVYIALGSLGPTYVGYVATKLSYTAAYTGFIGCFAVGIALLVFQWVRHRPV
jgi:MFS family permease